MSIAKVLHSIELDQDEAEKQKTPGVPDDQFGPPGRQWRFLPIQLPLKLGCIDHDVVELVNVVH